MNQTPTQRDPVVLAQAQHIVRGLYRGLLARDPEPAGLDYWSGVILAGGDAGAVLNALTQSDEFKALSAPLARRDAVRAALAAHAAEVLHARPLAIVDVGAQELEGEQHVYAALDAHGLPNRIIGFEPLADKRDESQRRNPRITLYPTFIGDGGTHTFHINNFDATSSLLPLNRALTADLVDLSNLATVSTEQVATSTLDAVLADTPYVDFLKLDIQGFELPALRHAGALLSRTNVVHCEVSFAEIYQGQALFSEVETLLRQHGFYFVDFSSATHYPYHCASGSTSRDRLGWGDAVFFKRPELVADEHGLLAQVLIAQFVYDKPSLAEFLAARTSAATIFGGTQ
ncbi:FkbM family methyltransferase [Massilia sp. GCM10020059]|uniref:FkbM family methyltransferase n=1 Tax=Massilia agrisoli TaxID=2892444 RepID=A0ABS8IXX4_9BURK|nr:FkbM family methyltransferase [Massilia agrisoli]MCC6073462.1 FkbM family methyltransferase [Massilia agrisoli]